MSRIPYFNVSLQVSTSILRSSDSSIVAMFRLHNSDGSTVLTLDVDEPRRGSTCGSVRNGHELQTLGDEIRVSLNSSFGPWRQQIPLLKLGCRAANRYLTTSDDRVVEYSVTKVLHDAVSKMNQHIQIVETVDQGRMLILDGFVNLAESDKIPYTHKLMALPEVFYIINPQQ